jgi:hypothetical protein
MRAKNQSPEDCYSRDVFKGNSSFDACFATWHTNPVQIWNGMERIGLSVYTTDDLSCSKCWVNKKETAYRNETYTTARKT